MCNRNGNVLPVSDRVQVEIHSLGGNLSHGGFQFPSSLSF